MRRISVLHSSVSRHLACFHVLVIVNSAAVSIRVHLSFQIIVFSGYMPRRRIAEAYRNYIFSFFRNLHTRLHSDYNSLIVLKQHS